MSKTVMDLVLESLEEIKEDLKDLKGNGCSKAPVHAILERSQENLFNRVRIVEQAQAEGKGRLAVVMVLAGALLSFGLQWLGSKL